MNPRAAARAIFDAALRAGEVGPLVERALRDLPLQRGGRLVVVGAGKASAAAVEEALGERITDGLVVVKDGYSAPTRRIRIVEAGHPVPDERGAAAAREIHALVSAAGRDDLRAVVTGAAGPPLPRERAKRS